MRYNRILCWSGCVLLVGLAACQSDSGPTSSSDTAPLALGKQTATYVISFGTTAPSDLAARIESAGGKVNEMFTDVGVARATSEASDFAAKVKSLPGVEAVGRDRVLSWVDPNLRVVDAGADNAIAADGSPSIGTNETFFRIQWALRAVDAADAWATGARGTGVRVAVLDGGINNNHIDFADVRGRTVDETCSASMVDGFEFNQDVPGFSHATHVGGIIAARNNSVGTIGIAPGATIMGVKVLQAGSGSFFDVIKGIRYAANPSDPRFPGKESCVRADVINMSLGATFVPEPGDQPLLIALNRATTYAFNQGVTVIASAGNNGLNLDRVPDVITVPAQSAHVLAVSATGPVGFALGATNFTRPASYSNFGKSLVSFGGPGGDFVLPGNDLCTHPLIPPRTITNFCWVFDLVLSPGTLPSNTGYFFAAGTSMAAPAAAAVAALIIEKRGRIPPAEVQAILRASSEDLGKPGFDAHFGHGFVNAASAVQ